MLRRGRVGDEGLGRIIRTTQVRLLVCGGRDYWDRDVVYATLDRLHNQICIDTIIQGGAKGADRLALDWAVSRRVAYINFVADWDRYGRAAGIIRNQEMLVEGRPDLVLAFPGGTGTADMVKKSQRAGLRVMLIGEGWGEVQHQLDLSGGI